MAKKAQAPALAEQHIEPESPEMELFLQAGYPGMTVDRANAIIEERKANPAAYPYEVAQQARAFLEAYAARPRAVSKRPAWSREEVAA